MADMADHLLIEPMDFTYRNYRGKVEVRRVVPRGIRFGTSEWHPEPQWLLRAFDLDRQAEREFAMREMWPVDFDAISALEAEAAEKQAAATEHQRLAASAQSAAHRLRNKAKTLRRERLREAKANG